MRMRDRGQYEDPQDQVENRWIDIALPLLVFAACALWTLYFAIRLGLQ